jgi:hypothetical protein
MHNFSQQAVNSGLAMEQQSWAVQIERSLQGVTQNLNQPDTGGNAEQREGWLLIERSLRLGADALQALPTLAG